jgi:hypothetical protein
VKRVLTWFAGLVSIAAFGRWLASRNKVKQAPAAPEPAAVPAAGVAEPEGDPAQELRRKLAETRAPSSPPADESVDERRARVHAEARDTIEAMADDGGSS